MREMPLDDEKKEIISATKEILRHINTYIAWHKLTWTWEGGVKLPTGDVLTVDALADRIWIQYNFRYAKPRYVAALKVERDRVKQELRQQLRDSIIEMPVQSDTALRFSVRAVTAPDLDDDTFEYYVQAVAQVIWNIKRRILGKPTNWEIFLMLYSETNGTGKSTWMRGFGAILKEWAYSDGDFELFKDQFSKKTFTDFYLIIFDEMSHGDPRLLGAIKNMITKDRVEGRVMYSDDIFTRSRTATMIGASNKPITEHVEDSGMRRWVQLNFIEQPLVKGSGHSVALNAIDWPAVWAGVDVNQESPYERHTALFRRHQRHLETRGSPEFLAIINDVLEETDSVDDCVLLSDVWKRYKQIAELPGYTGYKDFCINMTLKYGKNKIRRNKGHVYGGLRLK